LLAWVFASQKEVLGFRQFLLRGLAATAGEWCLVCLAFNLKRLHVLLSDKLLGSFFLRFKLYSEDATNLPF
jgi:hypothetical protein